MRHRLLAVTLLCSGVSFQPLTAQASSSVAGFAPGWYIVEPTATFVVLQLSVTDLQAQLSPDTIAARASIRAGEVVLAFEFTQDNYLIFESFGRISAVHGRASLTRAPAGGRPGYLTEEVQMMNGILAAGSTLWVLSMDPATATATVQLAGGRVQTIPSKNIALLSNAYGEALGRSAFRAVLR